MIEEPENGIHPKAVESVFQSLSSVYRGQVLISTHSPLFLGLAEPARLLCFAKNASGAVDIVMGHRHPALKNWHGEIDLTLFKELLAAILRQQNRPHSSALFQALAARIGLTRCQDNAFIQLRQILQNWFPSQVNF